MKSIAFISALLLMSVVDISAQSNSPATDTISDLLYKGTRPGGIVYGSGDFELPPSGRIMVADWRNLQACNQTIGGLLTSAPDDTSGKQSAWFGQLQTWKSSFDQFIVNQTQARLFVLVPAMAAYVGREDGALTLSSEMEQIEWQMRGMGYYVIKAMGNHITEQQAAVSAGNLSAFVRIFAVPGFVEEGSWEEEKKPVDAPGVMILDATAVVTQLRAGPWRQASQFLGGATAANEYFARYTGGGDGLAVLKTKYAANKSSIDAKFNELRTWVSQQEP